MTRRLLSIAWLVLLLGAGACLGEEPTTGDDGPGVDDPDFASLAQTGDTDFFRVDVGLEVASCSVAATCPETVGTEAKPSLLTGVSCGFPGAWDGLLLFSRQLVCTDGSTTTPITSPATTTGERAYAAERVDTHTDYVNTTQYLDPLASHDSCTYDAEAFILADDGAPAVYHRQNPARMTWHVEVDPALEGAAQCQFGGPSGVGIDYPASLTVSKPVAVTGAVRFDYATVSAASFPVTLGPSPVDGARVRYVLGATAPMLPTAVPTWAERDVWIAPFGDAYAVELDSTCVRTDPSTGELVSIGVLFRRPGYLGVVEVKSTNSQGARFDCERDPTHHYCTNVIPVPGTNGGEAMCAAALAGCYDGVRDGDETDVDCGGACTPCAAARHCADDGDCLSGFCDDSDPTPASWTCVAATSCNTLHTARPSTPSGPYEIDPDGAGSIAAFMAYCDMTPGDAGWTLVLRGGANVPTRADWYHGDAFAISPAAMNGSQMGPTFKLADATINAFSGVYRVKYESVGHPGYEPAYSFVGERYVPTTCRYVHTGDQRDTPDCRTTCSDVALTQCVQGAYTRYGHGINGGAGNPEHGCGLQYFNTCADTLYQQPGSEHPAESYNAYWFVNTSGVAADNFNCTYGPGQHWLESAHLRDTATITLWRK